MINKPAEVFFVAPSAYPLGGVAVWLNYLIPGLEGKGWKVTLALVGGHHHDVSAYRQAYPRLENVIEISNPTGSREGRVNSLLKSISLYNPDLVVGVNIPDCYEAVNRIRNKTRSETHVVMAIHGIQQDLLADIKEYREVLDGVVCTNRLTMHLTEELAEFDNSRIFYAPYGVKSEQSGTAKDTSGARLKIAWIGRFEEFQKRILDIPEIISELVDRGVDFEILIAGDGPEKGAIQEALQQQHLTRYTRFLGVVPSKEMKSKVYDACDILLVTSYWETGPIIIWEAMASGVPVVSSRYIGSGLEAGLVDGGNCLFFDIGDHKSAATQLQKLQDTELYLRLVAGGHELINDRYNKNISIQKWDKAFKEVLQLSARTAVSPRVTPHSGRLDELLGSRFGEFVRHSFGISHKHVTAGGEWPHTISENRTSDGSFWTMAARLDEKAHLSKE